MTEDEMVGWDHGLNGHGFGWTPGVDVHQLESPLTSQRLGLLGQEMFPSLEKESRL